MEQNPFLKFKPNDRPSWRQATPGSDRCPTVSTMVKDIEKYHSKWLEIRPSFKENKARLAEIKRNMVLEFLYRLQEGEDIGVNDRGTLEQKYDEEIGSLEVSPLKLARPDDDGEGSSPNKKLKFTELDEAATLNIFSDNEGVDSLPHSQEAEDLFQENSPNRITETVNLLRGYWHLKNEINKLSKDEQNKYAGEIDVDVCVQACHKILMKGLIDDDKTKPGQFSTLPRSAEFQGKVYHYPSYATIHIAESAVDNLITQYNILVDKIKTVSGNVNKIEMALKCASLLLFGFLTLHPFSDGNGRLGRLLCDHCLKTFCPFPTAIYNVFSPSTREDYVQALVNAREKLILNENQLASESEAVEESTRILEQGPSELCSLIIESNWFTWRHFLRKLGEDIPAFEFEKVN